MASRTPLTIPESDPRACSRGARVNALARVPFFAALDHDALHRIDERADVHAMNEGAAVYLAGRPARRNGDEHAPEDHGRARASTARSSTIIRQVPT